MRSMLLECIVLQSELSELYEHSVHQALPKRQQAVHEANMAASTGSDEDKIRIGPCLLLWDGCKNKLEEENKGDELILTHSNICSNLIPVDNNILSCSLLLWKSEMGA